MKIKTILESLRDDIGAGKITIKEATEELCAAGWMNFYDEQKARRLLGIAPSTGL